MHNNYSLTFSSLLVIRYLLLILAGALIGSFFIFGLTLHIAKAAITEVGPPISALPNSVTVGGGSILPLAKFMLSGDGASGLQKVGFILRASTTMDSLAQISGIALYRESGTHFDFQPNEDIALGGAYLASANLATSTLLLLQPTGYAPASGNTEFFVVASTSAMTNIINGNAFDIQFQAEYASTTAGGIGTAALNPATKIIFQQTLPLKISEVKAGSTSNDRDEFIEFYNPDPYYIDIQRAGVSLHIFNTSGGVATTTFLTYAPGRNIVPETGFFLITSATNYTGSEPADATYNNTATNFLASNTGLAISTSSTAANATSTKIDLIGWGTQPSANCENSDTLGSACAPVLAEDSQSLERIAQGYPNATSTAADLAAGGAHQFKGNAVDRNDNSAEFVLQSSPKPQNTFSPSEFPFGGGTNDTGGPRVVGSYPGSNMTNVPIDISYIGFGFNEPVATSTIISATATTTVTLTASGSQTNLCTSVSYNPMPGNFEPPAKCNLSAQLSPNTVYTFTATSTIRDLQGNALDQDSFQAGNQPYQITFTTGGASQTMTNITPPDIVGSMPFPGSRVPTNIQKFFIAFSQPMDNSTFNASNILLFSYPLGVRTAVSLSSAVFSYNASTSVLTINSLPSLSDNTHYDIELDGQDSGSDISGVKSANNILLPTPAWIIPFDTSTNDTTAPQVLGVMPIQPGATNVPLNNITLTVVFDDHIDVTTATSGAAALAISGGAAVPTDLSYDPVAKEGSVTARNLLPANQTLVLTLYAGNLKNISGTALASNYTMSFTTEAVNSDITAPQIAFANADEFGIAITYNEAVNSTDATNLSNYSVVYTPSGGSQQTLTLNSMAGHTITYNPARRTAKISGIYLPSSASFTVTASNIRDISGNLSASSQITGTVLSRADSGGFIDPGMAGGTGTPPPPMTFSTASGGGFLPPANIMTMNNFVSASSTYGFEIPISQQIPANGQIVITFPSNSDFSVCCAATSSPTMLMLNDANRDINGPGIGTIGIKTITRDNIAKTITLTIDTATRSENSDTHDFLRFGLTDIKNPSVPKGPDSSGYLIDIKTKNSSGAILESNFNVNPVFIGGGSFGGMATTTVRGRVLSGYDSSTGLNGVRIMLHSPILGPMPQAFTSAANGYGGGAAGEFQFTNLPVNNDYFIFTDPMVSPTGTTTGYFGFMEPMPVRATSTSIITRNLVLTATTSAVSLTVKLTAPANTFGATEQIDVFAGGPGQFVVQTIAPGIGALDNASVSVLSIPRLNGMWFVGMGPAMPKDGMMMGGPPPSPNWVMPKPIELNMSGCPSNCVLSELGIPKTEHTFVVSAANKTISGVVKDASGVTLSGAMVFAYSPSAMSGAFGQTDTAGKFSLNVATGTYNVGAFFPGMGNSPEASVDVVSGTGSNTVFYVGGSKTASTGSGGANPFTLTIKRPAYKITGRISDGANSISNAPVFAYRTNGPGHADTMSDSSGNYTLYVDNGTWKVNAHIPGYGPMTEQTVTIAGADQTNINFSPSGATTYWSIVGTVFESSNATIDAGEGISSVIVSARRSGNIFETKTGTDGTYTLRVPEGSGYLLEAYKPGYGQIPSVDENLAAIGSFNVTGTTTKNIRLNSRQTVTINIKDASGNFITVPEAFIDLFDITKNFGNHAEIRNGTSTTLQIANMSSTTIRAFIPSVPPNSIYFATDSPSTTFADSANTILNVDGSETVKIVINTTLRTISGTVYHTAASSGNELKDAWVEVIDTTNGMHYGTAATSSAGTYSIKLVDGTYKIMAVKPGYTMQPLTLTVSGNATQNLIMTSANLTISGTITAGGVVAPNAFVRAEKLGGGFSVTQADASGNYALSVDSGQWRIFAASDKYSEGAYSGNPLNVTSSQTGINIALTSAASIQDKLATSATFKDTASGSFEDATVKTKVTVDSGSLGQSGSDSYITAQETANYPKTSSVNVIAGKAKDINAYSAGSQVKTLQSGKKATVELTYTVAELASSGIDTPSEVAQLKISTLNEQKEWETLSTIATYNDSSGNALAVATTSSSIPGTVASVAFTTNEATHFSAYALTQANDPSAPPTPTGLTATAGSAGSGQIALSWSASSGAEGYYIYRDTSESGSFGLLTDAGNVTSYTNTGLSSNTYYYKIGAYKDSGTKESTSTPAVSAVLLAAPGGGGIVSGGGGAVAPTVPSQIPLATSTPSTPTPTSVSAPSAPVAPAVKISAIFSKTLKLGIQNSDVERLQTLLSQDKEIYPEGKITGYFGSLTRKAVQRFQEKHGIAKKGDSGYGLVGPKTRANLQEVFGEVKEKVEKAPEAVSAEKQVLITQIENQIKALQEQVAQLLLELQKLLQKQL